MAELCQPIQRETTLGRLLEAQDLLPKDFEFAEPSADSGEVAFGELAANLSAVVIP